MNSIIHSNPPPGYYPPPLPSANNVVMIDNYDSFTWNVYQFLALEGASVTVHRNDKITLQQLIDSNPTQLVVSPGPGHPEHDAGISQDAIRQFAGKIPILGVCMGEQCIYSVFGGKVSYAGEVVHGKTSQIKHDGRGIYQGVPQDIVVTRYHSLAGTHDTLPDVLEVTSRTDSGVIMGVRHKVYTIEGVQYHPESILTEAGRLIIRNFLRIKGGTWKESEGASEPVKDAKQTQRTSILEEIYTHRHQEVRKQKNIPSQRPQDLQAQYDLGLAPPLINLATRLRAVSTKVALMAEIKRASPSKGVIDIDVNAVLQARTYALAGAAAISVLTEPKWFKGGIDDLRAARQAVEYMPHRPAILRKEFIFEEYQILEARLAGADTVLLIVKMLNDEKLERLYKYSKSLGMEPLVEVNSKEEMQRALKIGAKVIGVNNRDLHSFKVDLETTSGLVSMVNPDEVILCALSGISAREDVARYETEGVGAVLVGEALMRAGKGVKDFIKSLLSDSSAHSPAPAPTKNIIIKICGTRTVEAAKVAIESGADLVGIILAEGTKRTVGLETARAISDCVHSTLKGGSLMEVDGDDLGVSSVALLLPAPSGSPIPASEAYFSHAAKTALIHPTRSLLVGVFRNQPLDYVLHLTKILELDIVQLHGNEPVEWARLIPVPVIKKFDLDSEQIWKEGCHAVSLLDSGSGGTGQLLDLTQVKKLLDSRPDKAAGVVLAGGLNEKNVIEVISEVNGADGKGVIAVDVCSGVELDGRQDLRKIRRLVYKLRGKNVSGL